MSRRIASSKSSFFRPSLSNDPAAGLVIPKAGCEPGFRGRAPASVWT